MRRAGLAAVFLLPLAALAPASARAGAAVDYDAQLAAKAPAIVSLKYLASYEGSTDYPATGLGVVIDPSGLVLASNENFGDGSIRIRDVKVLVGNDPKEWPAILVARDTNLDLAYVQVVDTEGKAFASVDLEKGRDPKIGEDLFGVGRQGRGFDYAPSLKRLYVTCRIENPRVVYDFAGDFGEAGLPAFDATGAPVGILVNQQSAEGADEGGGSHHDVFILPLGAVGKSVAQARKRVPDALAKAKEAAKEEPKDGAPKAPDAPKPPDAPGAPAPSSPVK